MAALTKAERDRLPPHAFALPGRRFPIHDDTHAKAALSGAKRALKKKHITEREYQIVVDKAHKVLAKADKEAGKENFGITPLAGTETSIWNLAHARDKHDVWYDVYFE